MPNLLGWRGLQASLEELQRATRHQSTLICARYLLRTAYLALENENKAVGEAELDSEDHAEELGL